MKKGIIIFCLFLFPFAFVFPQTEVKSDCETNLEDIFKVHTLKIKYDAVLSLYKELDIKDSIIREKDNPLWRYKKCWDDYSVAIRGVPMVFENHNNSIFEVLKIPVSDANSKGCEIATNFSEDQMNEFIRQIDYTPDTALEEYRDYIRKIKLEKEKYLTCIEVELDKDSLSEYARKRMVYTYHSSTKPMVPLPYSLSQLDFLKIFKDFVINANIEVLPLGVTAYVYLKCNCHIPLSLYYEM